MGRGPNGGGPVLDLFVEQWPMLVLVPAILILIAVLAGVTAWWDRRDAQRAGGTTARRTDARTVRTVAGHSTRSAGSRIRLGWRRRTRCTCSWHTVPTRGGDPVREPSAHAPAP